MGRLKLTCYTDGDFKFDVDNKAMERLNVIYHEDGFIQYQEFVLKFENDNLIKPLSFLTLLKVSLRTHREYVKKDVIEMLDIGINYLNWVILNKETPKELQTCLNGNYDGTGLTITFEEYEEESKKIDLKNSIDFLRDKIVYNVGTYEEALTHLDDFELIINALLNGVYVKEGYSTIDYKKINFSEFKPTKAITLEYITNKESPIEDLANSWVFFVVVEDQNTPCLTIKVNDYKNGWNLKRSE